MWQLQMNKSRHTTITKCAVEPRMIQLQRLHKRTQGAITRCQAEWNDTRLLHQSSISGQACKSITLWDVVNMTNTTSINQWLSKPKECVHITQEQMIQRSVPASEKEVPYKILEFITTQVGRMVTARKRSDNSSCIDASFVQKLIMRPSR